MCCDLMLPIATRYCDDPVPRPPHLHAYTACDDIHMHADTSNMPGTTCRTASVQVANVRFEAARTMQAIIKVADASVVKSQIVRVSSLASHRSPHELSELSS